MWPETMKVGPIREWPGALRSPGQRRTSSFRSTLTSTLKILDKEIFELVDTRAQQNSAELLIAIPAGGFRKDGRPRSDARAEHPGVIFSLDSRHGHLSYPCDTFDTWQDNLRAIALALQALRQVDRYGVTAHGEQYRGFMAIESGVAATMSTEAAVQILARVAKFNIGASPMADDEDLAEARRRLILRAKRHAHPDRGGSRADWDLVAQAEAVLDAAGLLS
jgi:hypothetical protein